MVQARGDLWGFDDDWAPFLGGTGSAPRYCASLSPDERERLRERLRQRVPTGPDGEILLAIRAWGVKGKVGAERGAQGRPAAARG
jgi:hypothetical protein